MNAQIIDILNVLDDAGEDRALSIYEGIAGEALFRSVAEKLALLPPNDTLHVLLDRLVTDVADFGDKPAYTFSSGISGTLWLFHYLNKKGLIEVDGSFFEDIDEITGNVAIRYLEYKDYDILHGACGIMLSLLMRPESNKERLTQLTRLLLDARIDFNGFNIWEFRSVDTVDGITKVNMGLAHGIPAVMVILGKLYKANILPQECEAAIMECFEFIKQNRNTHISDSSFSLYPTFISNTEDNRYESRMAWCYGDPGIGIALYVTGCNINNSELTEEANAIFLYYSGFRNHPKLLVRDASFCHGAAGLMHMYYRMYYNTKNEVFKDTASYWYNIVLQMGYHEDGLAGYKMREEKGWLNKSGLLEGITGIGLVMSSYLLNENPDWDECFFLS